MWLVGHQLGRLAAPWRDPYSFQPESHPVLNLQGWLYGLPYWPVDRLLGPVVAWNAVVLVSYVVAGGATCWWLRSLGLQRGAALLGGLAFALAPYRVMQSTWHLLGMMAFLLPLALLGFERGRDGARAGSRSARAALVAVPRPGSSTSRSARSPSRSPTGCCAPVSARRVARTVAGAISRRSGRARRPACRDPSARWRQGGRSFGDVPPTPPTGAASRRPRVRSRSSRCSAGSYAAPR